MRASYLTKFEFRQEMRRDDFEIFYRLDSASSTIALHQHDFYELYCLLSGELEFIVEGCRYVMKPGMLLLIAPGEMHRSVSQDAQQKFERVVLWMSRDFVHSLSSILPRIVQTIAREDQGWNLIVPDDETFSVLHSLLFSLLYEKDLADPDSPFLSRLIVMQLLVHLSRFLSHAPFSSPARQDIRYEATMKVYEYVNQHFKEELTVALLAEQFYMDKNTLTRQFKRIIGLTPGEYIRRKRLENARELIRRGVGAQEAGFQSGFSDYSAFYRAFRQEYGSAPSILSGQKEKTEEARHDA